MELIDDNGRIFGLVNVIDALAVLLVIAVVSAGAALVFSEPETAPKPETSTLDATLDLGPQPDYVVSAIQEGDSYSPAAHSTLTITEVVLSPHNGTTRVLLGITLEGIVEGETLRYNGAPPRLGRTLKIATKSYELSGTLVDTGGTPSRETTSVLVADTVSSETAAAIDQGDTYGLAGRTLGTVRTVAVYGTANPDRKRVLVGLHLETLVRGDRSTFAGKQIRYGTRIPFETNEYQLSGEIQRIGSVEQRGSPTTRTVTLQWRNVPPELADAIQTGMAETAGGTTIVEITSVEREPATVILTSQDGQIYERDHPENKDLTITASFRVHETATGVTFKGQTVQQGSTVVLDLGSITLRATIVSL